MPGQTIVESVAGVVGGLDPPLHGGHVLEIYETAAVTFVASDTVDVPDVNTARAVDEDGARAPKGNFKSKSMSENSRRAISRLPMRQRLAWTGQVQVTVAA